MRPEEASPLAWLRWVPAAVLTGFALYFFYVVASVALVPVLASVGLAYLLDPMARYGETRGLSRTVASLAAIAVVSAVIVALMAFVVPELWGETSKAISRLAGKFTPQNAAKERAFLKKYSPPLERVIGERVEEFLSDPSNLLDPGGSTEPGSEAGGGGQRLLLSSLASSLDLLLVPFFVFYILVDFRRWRQSFDELIPDRYRGPFGRLFDESGRILESYVRGQIVISLCLAVACAFAFALLGVPAWMGISLVVGLVNVVPYIGMVVGLVLAAGFTLSAGGSNWDVAAVVAAYGLIQVIKGYVLTPRILGGRLNLHPMAVFLGLLIGGKLFGFWGVLLAIPVIAVAKVFLMFLKELYQGSAFYQGGGTNAPAVGELEDRIADAADAVLAEQASPEAEGDPPPGP